MVSRHHLIGWRRCEVADVVAIADPAADSLAHRADEFRITRRYPSVEAMLDAGGVDALDIASPLATHGPLLEVAAARGVPVLCQKPLAASSAQAAAIAAVPAQRGVRLMVHENWRFRPHYRTLATWLREGRIGQPRAFHLSTLGSGLLPAGDGPPPGLMRQPFLAGMERLIVLELLVHHLDTLAFLFGPLVVTAARTARLSPHVVGEDSATIMLCGDGVAGTLFASMAAYGHPARGVDRLEVLGDGGRIALSADRLVCDGRRAVSIAVDIDADYQASYDGVVDHFAGALIEDTPFETPPEVHIAALRRVEMAYELAERLAPTTR